MASDINSNDGGQVEMPDDYVVPQIDEVAQWLNREFGYSIADLKPYRSDSVSSNQSSDDPDENVDANSDNETEYGDDDDADVLIGLDEDLAMLYGTPGAEAVPPPPPPLFDDTAVIPILKNEVETISARLPAYVDQSRKDVVTCENFANSNHPSPQQREDDWNKLLTELNPQATWVRGNGMSGWDRDEARLQQISMQCFSLTKQALGSQAGLNLRQALESAGKLINQGIALLQYAENRIVCLGHSMRNVNWQAELERIVEEATSLREEFSVLADLSDIDCEEAECWLVEWVKNPGGNPQKEWADYVNLELEIQSTWLRGAGNSEWDVAESALRQLNSLYATVPANELTTGIAKEAAQVLNSTVKASNMNLQRIVANHHALLTITRELNPTVQSSANIVELFANGGAYGVQPPPDSSWRDTSEIQKFVDNKDNQQIEEIAELVSQDQAAASLNKIVGFSALASKFAAVKSLCFNAKVDEASKQGAPLLVSIPNAIGKFQAYVATRIANLHRAIKGFANIESEDAKIQDFVDRAASTAASLNPNDMLGSYPLVLEIEPLIRQAYAMCVDVSAETKAVAEFAKQPPVINPKTVTEANHEVLLFDTRAKLNETNAAKDFKVIVDALGNPAGAIDADQSGKEVVDMLLSMDDLTREVLFESSFDPQGLAKIIQCTPYRERSKMVTQIIKSSNTDANERLFQTMLQNEIDGCKDMSAFMREQEVTVVVLQKLTGGKAAQMYKQGTISAAFERISEFQLDPDQAAENEFLNLEVDLKKIREQFPNMENATEVPAKIKEIHIELVEATMKEIAKSNPPNDVARPMAELYERTLKRFQADQADDDNRTPEERALALVGGHLMLRMLSPKMLEPQKNQSKEQRRVAVIQSKLLQSISNGVMAREKSMQIFADFLKGADGQPSEASKTMTEFLKKVVLQGQNAPDALKDAETYAPDPFDAENTLIPPATLSANQWKKVANAAKVSKSDATAIEGLLSDFETTRDAMKKNIYDFDMCQKMEETLQALKGKLRAIDTSDANSKLAIDKMIGDARGFAMSFNESVIKNLSFDVTRVPGGIEVFKEWCVLDGSVELVPFFEEAVLGTNRTDADRIVQMVNTYIDVPDEDPKRVNFASRIYKAIVKAKNGYVDAGEDQNAKNEAKPILLTKWAETLDKARGFKGLAGDVITRYTAQMRLSID